MYLKAFINLHAFSFRTGRTVERSALLTLQEAQAHLALGNFSKASRKCGDVLRALTHRGSWTKGQIRSSCVEVGAKAALALGDIKGAKNFLSVALRVRRCSQISTNCCVGYIGVYI